MGASTWGRVGLLTWERCVLLSYVQHGPRLHVQGIQLSGPTVDPETRVAETALCFSPGLIERGNDT